MARSPQPLQRIFAADPALAAWTARHRHKSALTAHVRRHLPRALAEHVHVADDRSPELSLATDSGAIAGIVRQRAPDLLADLRREGYEFTSIRVRVQVGARRAESKKSVSKQIDGSSLRPLGALADRLPDGPLKAALVRFLRRVG